MGVGVRLTPHEPWQQHDSFGERDYRGTGYYSHCGDLGG